ncbi:MAG: hypothetical protein GXO86_15555 [Chlorobi bacterium]|nr:hypothetical protein [Chlorobiota bacterium]
MNRILKSRISFIVLLLLGAMLAGSCSRHNYNSTYKRKKKRKCDCPRWSYNQNYENSTYVLNNFEKWDHEHNLFFNLDPVQLIKVLMEEHNLKQRDLVKIPDLSKGTASKILNYHNGLSKETIRKPSQYFKVSQDMFNRPYNLLFHDTDWVNTKKDIELTT